MRRKRLLGCTRVSTKAQDAQLQLDSLVTTGVHRPDIFSASGSRAAVQWPGMRKLLEYAEAGDTVVVWRVDRSLIDVLNTVSLLRGRGVELRSISDDIDPAITSGRLVLNMLATLAEYERALMTERVNACIAAAKASGTRFGRSVVDSAVTADKLAIVRDARAKGMTAAEAALEGGVEPGDFVPTPKSASGH